MEKEWDESRTGVHVRKIDRTLPAKQETALRFCARKSGILTNAAAQQTLLAGNVCQVSSIPV